MPILPKESDFYPEDLFDLPTAEAPWEIVHLRSRQEKTVARLLREAEMPFYLPQIEKKKKSSDRMFISHLPLFPGYIFVRRVTGLRETLWRASAVANMLEVSDQLQLTVELLQIRQLQASGAVLIPLDELAPGDTVRITEGSFSGYTGVILKEHGSLRLIVSVSILHKSVAVEFPHELLTRVNQVEGDRDRRGV